MDGAAAQWTGLSVSLVGGQECVARVRGVPWWAVYMDILLRLFSYLSIRCVHVSNIYIIHTYLKMCHPFLQIYHLCIYLHIIYPPSTLNIKKKKTRKH